MSFRGTRNLRDSLFRDASFRMTKKYLNETFYDTEFIDAWEFVLWVFGGCNNKRNGLRRKSFI